MAHMEFKLFAAAAVIFVSIDDTESTHPADAQGRDRVTWAEGAAGGA